MFQRHRQLLQKTDFISTIPENADRPKGVETDPDPVEANTN